MNHQPHQYSTALTSLHLHQKGLKRSNREIMRPTTTSAPVTGTQLWKSPVPYLFGGLAAMLALIGVALVILACSHLKRSSTSPTDHSEDDLKSPLPAVDHAEPKIVVIMPGDDKPTYIATPFTSSPTCSTEQV